MKYVLGSWDNLRCDMWSAMLIILMLIQNLYELIL